MRHSRNDRQRVISKKVLRTQIPNRKTRFGKRHIWIWYAWQVQRFHELQEIIAVTVVVDNGSTIRNSGVAWRTSRNFQPLEDL
jgi:hypothetical protein